MELVEVALRNFKTICFVHVTKFDVGFSTMTQLHGVTWVALRNFKTFCFLHFE
jgi:hypothetical protein